MPENPTARFWWTVRDAPIGPLLLAATTTGLVTVAFHAAEPTVSRTLRRLAERLRAQPVALRERPAGPGDKDCQGAAGEPGARAAGETGAGAGAVDDDGAVEVLRRTSRELDSYFAGTLREFSVPLDWSLLSDFHSRVLSTLARTVAYGRVTGYQDLARAVGEPGAARAVGVAMGANPLPVVVPCHRVVESDGGIGGFSGGLETKRSLLALEGVLPPPLFE
ncbi:methylated-DNA--[protein]-cysteine S-methyltransferase [Streptomyces sp. P38-E01]|uniref:Methylated-DNA--protein-cysteine methyltransferase n=1 Tax=Streptomyces tardus TaxID=2780544 RepID=A0A949JGE8_9ACTN|nr:methylated-DNA--[protein]-cysteine S-methyltransferase [Streptomyces tardus]MBU7599648.1 methylated-DNA--[protein]-cysteine S-methyltransferase [Streptomyces tardus]